MKVMIMIKKMKIEKYKDLLENPNFEQDFWSRQLLVFIK